MIRILTQTIVPKDRGRQLSTQVCGSESAIFPPFFVQTTLSNNNYSKKAQVLTLIFMATQKGVGWSVHLA